VEAATGFICPNVAGNAKMTTINLGFNENLLTLMKI
jgi:hypothetical protein